MAKYLEHDGGGGTAAYAPMATHPLVTSSKQVLRTEEWYLLRQVNG